MNDSQHHRVSAPCSSNNNNNSVVRFNPQRRERSPEQTAQFAGESEADRQRRVLRTLFARGRLSTTTTVITNRNNARIPTASELFMNILAQSKQPALQAQSADMVATARSALAMIGKMWADTTWQSRANEWKRFLAFCMERHLDPFHQLDWAAVLWAESLRASALPASRLRYVSDIMAIASRLGLATPIGRMYASGLRRSGALVPQNQAPAISVEQMQLLRNAALTQPSDNRLCAVLFLMWKSASRADEVLRLQGKQILQVEANRLIIYWGDRTKTSAANPFRLDMYTIVQHEPALPPTLLATFQHLQAHPEEYLINHTTSWLDRWLADTMPDAGLSAHSIKRGALGFLAKQIVDGHLDANLLAVMAKHKRGIQLPFDETTARYIANKCDLATIVGTQHATVLLPW